MSDNPPVKLPFRRKKFIEEYLANGGNGRQAAADAGYAGNELTLRVTAHEVLTDPNVQLQIQASLDAAAATADRVIAELAAVAFADWEKLVEVRTGRDGRVVDAKIVLADKVRALELLGKYHGLFRDRVDVTHEEVVRVLEYVDPRRADPPARADDGAGLNTIEPEIG